MHLKFIYPQFCNFLEIISKLMQVNLHEVKDFLPVPF